MATQNPIEQEGTYPLPEAQVDRFQMRLLVEYPTRSEEKQILRLFNKKYNEDHEDILAVTDPTSIIDMQHKAKEIFVEEDIIDYITDIVFYTRENANVLLGGSPRASIALLKTSKVKAMIHGRDYVIPDDIKELTPHILNHRVILTPEAELEGLKPLDIINEALETVWI
ncbi:MAG: AAA family ATPase [Methanosarcinales archaeon]